MFWCSFCPCQIIVYRTEHNYIIPLAPPITPPRRRRSRSQLSGLTEDDRISQGADSYMFDEEPAVNEEKFIIDVKDGNGYLIITYTFLFRALALVNHSGLKTTNLKHEL